MKIKHLTHHVLSTYDEDVQAKIDELVPIEYHMHSNRICSMAEDEITEACIKVNQRYDGKYISNTV